MQNVRIMFSKRGDAVYISHLDLMRCFTRAVKRAGIPVLYTEGFNPRAYMNFAMPLSLGIEGLHEILDIRTSDGIAFDEIKAALSSTMPPDITILDVKEPVNKATQVAFSKYKVEICQNEMKPEAFNNAISELISREKLEVSKLGKQGKRKVVKVINLTEHIKDFKSWVSNEGNTVITFILPSGTQFGINPTLLTNKLFEESGVSPVFVHITRKCMLTEALEEFE